MQVTIPVKIPGQPLASISVLTVQKHDTRLLQLASILGPLIADAAQQIAKDLAKQDLVDDDDHDHDEETPITTGMHAVVRFPMFAGLSWTCLHALYLCENQEPWPHGIVHVFTA